MARRRPHGEAGVLFYGLARRRVRLASKQQEPPTLHSTIQLGALGGGRLIGTKRAAKVQCWTVAGRAASRAAPRRAGG